MTSGLNVFDLLNLDPKTGEAPETRVKDVSSALAIFETLRKADENSSINRAHLDAMFDGAAPYDRKILEATGQGNRTNLNWGEAQRYLDISMSAFVDLYSSLERLVNVKVKVGEPALREEAQDIIAEEVTHTLREWPAFHSSYMRLCTEFVKHGVSVAYFDNPNDWRFRVSGLGDFVIPRQTEASEDAVEVAFSRRQYLLHELFALTRNPEAAAKKGWDVEEIKRVIIANATTTRPGSRGTYTSWEDVQREVKNNDIYTGVQNTAVSIIHMWTREFSGRVSFHMFAEESPKTFIFAQTPMFERPEQAYVLFTYGVGTNGTYHSVRGLGHRIFNHVQTSNRVRCQRVDSAMLGGSVMLQPETQRALEDLSFTMYGPYSILSPNVRVVEKAAPNLSQTMDPALADLGEQLARNVDLLTTYGERGSPYRNNLQVEHDLAVSSTLTGATLNLFYAGWTRLLRETTRRLIVGNPSRDPFVKDFYDRCAERGISKAIVQSVAHSKTHAVRSIGHGSAANRLLALRDLNQLAGSYDEVGRRNLVRDLTAERVGRDLVDRYAPPSPEPRDTADAKIALLENQSMQSGLPVPVLPTELHGMHLRMHAPLLQQLLAGVAEGQLDPVAVLPILELLQAHCVDHTEMLAGDPSAAAEVAGMRQLLQQSNEIIVNYGRKAQAAAQRAEESGDRTQDSGDRAQEGPTAAELKFQEFELRQQMIEQKARLDMEIKQRKAEQDLALKDAERAAALQ